MFRNRLLKILALLMVLNILIIPLISFCPQEQNKYTVHAFESVPELTQTGVVAVTGMIMLMMASNNLIADGITLTATQIGQISSNVKAKLIAADPAGQLINQANSLGTSLKNGANLASIQAMTSGALIYAYLSALQETLFPDKNYPVISGQGALVSISGNKALYAYCDSSVYGGDHPITSFQFTSSDGALDYYKFEIFNSSSRSSLSAFKYTIINTDTWLQHAEYVNTGYYFDIYGFYGMEINSTSTLSQILKGSLTYSPAATKIDESNDVILPTVLPQTVINNITNYDGISDLVLGIPEGYTVPADNSITVNPGTIVDNPPIDVPVDPPVEPTLIGTVAAILAGLTPIAGFLEYILAGQVSLTDTIEVGITGVIDGIGDIAGTLTGGITSSLTDIQSSISTLFDPPTETLNLEKLKNLNSVLFTKFPFSIPFDFVSMISAFSSNPVAPVITIPFDMSDFGGEFTEVKMDLSDFNNIAAVARQIGFIGFVFFMLFNTRKLIWK
ncbi:MAG: hypothetical protein CVU00_15230 [Bacteroidetes bacterium HGW-Bacteroidetes-17]|nr:MAG: hypothetical protein CVU00_15230 [Bacteroidetes bacterium HGW-Bacteroidetes-17]